jgi:predicted ester cyclase
VTTQQKEQKQIFRRVIEHGFNRGDLGVVDELFSPAFVEHQPLGPDAPRGREAPAAIIQSLHRSFSDFSLAIEDIACEADRVWVRLRAAGTNDGPYHGHAPTGKRIAADVIDVVRMDQGRIVEHWGVPDRLAILHQLGHAA